MVVVGQPAGVQWWRDASISHGPEIILFNSLTHCLAELPVADNAVTASGLEPVGVGPCVALMQLSDSDGLPDEGTLAAELGQAVRRFPQRLLVSIETSEPNDAAFFAFGFRKLQMEHQESIRLFEYCLSEYKQSPDWLNARYWANPERFSLDDDPDGEFEDSDDEEE